MERKVGEVFTTYLKNTPFKVTVKTVHSLKEINCNQCAFKHYNKCRRNLNEVGFCCSEYRKDKNDVSFIQIV